MRASIIGTLLASQDNMDKRKNSFELYGADFMLTEDFCPWLIEINSCPCMSATTSVTARMCSQCLEDVIKVVVDRRQDKRADTGMFECIYKQRVSPAPPYLGMTLAVRGNKCNLKGIKPTTNIRSRKNEFGIATVDKNMESMKACLESHSYNETEMVKSDEIKYNNPGDMLGPVVIDFIEDLAEQLTKDTSIFDGEDVVDKRRLTDNTLNATDTESETVLSWKEELFGKSSSKKSKKLSTKRSNSPRKGKKSSGNKLSEKNEKLENETKCINLNATAFSHNVSGGECRISEHHSIQNKKMKHPMSDSSKPIELFSGWRQKLDETRNNCQSILANLNTSSDSANESKLASSTLNKNVKWASEVSIQSTVREFVNQLSQSISDRKSAEKQFLLGADSHLPFEKGFGKIKFNDSRVRQCYLNILLNNGQLSKFSRVQEVFNPQYLDQKFPMVREICNDMSVINQTNGIRGVLPTIKQRKQFSINNNEDDERQNKLCALGISLKSFKFGMAQQDHLLMPIGGKQSAENNANYNKTILAK